MDVYENKRSKIVTSDESVDVIEPKGLIPSRKMLSVDIIDNKHVTKRGRA